MHMQIGGWGVSPTGKWDSVRFARACRACRACVRGEAKQRVGARRVLSVAGERELKMSYCCSSTPSLSGNGRRDRDRISLRIYSWEAVRISPPVPRAAQIPPPVPRAAQIRLPIPEPL